VVRIRVQPDCNWCVCHARTCGLPLLYRVVVSSSILDNR